MKGKKMVRRNLTSLQKTWWGKGWVRKSKRRICLVIRLLHYAVQIARHGCLIDPRV